MTGAWWVNGGLVDSPRGAGSLADHGLLVGDGVFTTVAVSGGVPQALTRHLGRLASGLAALGIAPVQDDTLREAVAAVVGATAATATRLRITVTSGEGPMGLRRGDAPTVIVWAGQGPSHTRCEAIRVAARRNEHGTLVGVKTTSYAEHAVLFAKAQAAGADEALLATTAGELCEGIGSNVFVEHGGEVLTPSLATGCLPGIARALILEWGPRAGIPVREARAGELPYEVLDAVAAGVASAAVSSSTRGLQALSRLDGTPTVEGQLLTALAGVLADGLAADPDPQAVASSPPM